MIAHTESRSGVGSFAVIRGLNRKGLSPSGIGHLFVVEFKTSLQLPIGADIADPDLQFVAKRIPGSAP